MSEGHIYIYGEISGWQDSEAANWGMVNMKDVNAQLQKVKESEQIIVHINSPGGEMYEGFGIADMLANTGKKTVAHIEGMCASMATIIAISCDVVKATPNSTFMIHNGATMAYGTVEEIEAQNAELKRLEDRAVQMYVTKSGLSEEDIRALIAKDTYMFTDEAIEKGFIDEEIQQLKAVARLGFKHKQPDNMNNEEVKEKLTGIEKMLAKLFPAKPKALVKQDANGVEINMPEIETEEQIAVGVTATIDGNPAEGEYQIPGLGTVIFTDGAIAEIIPVDEGGADGEEMEALKQENADLKQQLDELSASMKDRDKEVAEMRKNAEKVTEELKNFKAKFSDDKTPPADPPTGGDEPKKKSFKYNGRKK